MTPARASSLAVDREPGSVRQLRVLEAPPALRDAPALIERESELAAIDQAIGRLAGGTGGVVMIEAGPGLGTTALLEHAARAAIADGSLVRRAAPSPHERDFRFGTIRLLLEAPLRSASDPERARLLAGPAAPAGALLLEGSDPAQAATLVAHSIFWLCAGLSDRQPLTLILDDAQWSDRCSLRVVSYLARRAEDLPLLIVVGARARDAGAGTELAGLSTTPVLRPAPLTRNGAARLIRRLAPDAPINLACDCHAAAAGNPWLLRALAAELAARGPAALGRLGAEQPVLSGGLPVTGATRDVVRRRIAELGPRERAAAAALALIGAGAAPHAVASVAGIALSDLGPACDALAEAGLLTADRQRFAHQLIAAAITEDLGDTERRRLHRESARALAEIGAPDAEIASHLLQCWPQGDPDAGRTLARAAQDALRLGSPGAAAIYLERALSERGRGEDCGALLERLGTSTFDAGRPGSRGQLRAALEHAADDAAHVDRLTRLTTLSVFAGDPDAPEELERRRPGSTSRAGRTALGAAMLDALLTVPGRHAERARRADAPELAASADAVIRRAALAHRAWLATELGSRPASECAALALEALEGDWLLADAWRRVGYHLCVHVLVLSDRVEHAQRAIGALREEALARGSQPMQAAAAWYAAELALRTGRVSEADTDATRALEMADGTDAGAFGAGAISVLVRALAERGRVGPARDLLREHGFYGPLARRPWDVAMLAARSQLSLAEGDFERAYGEACDVGERSQQQGQPNPTVTGWRAVAALALAHLGRRSEAVQLAGRELKLAERFGAPVPVARALAALAVAEPDEKTRIRLSEAALARLHGEPAVLELTRLRLELGSALARSGRRVQAREALRPALADADAAGASSLATRARRELVATGLRPRRAALEGTAALTARQRQICELAAAGEGNRAIARQLFLSIKTVETHLAVAYRKLGVGHRDQLNAVLAGSNG